MKLTEENRGRHFNTQTQATGSSTGLRSAGNKSKGWQVGCITGELFTAQGPIRVETVLRWEKPLPALRLTGWHPDCAENQISSNKQVISQ